MTKFLLLLVFVSYPTLAQFAGSVEFTPEEISQHHVDVETIVPAAVNCLKRDLKTHKDFHKRYGISAFYGDQSAFARMTLDQRKAELKRLRIPTRLVSQLQPTSCVGLARKCLGEGFAKAGDTEIWKKVDAFLVANDLDGTALQEALRKLGWKTLYWNPDLSQNAAWDEEEKLKDPTNIKRFWGYHAYRLITIQRKGMYYFNKVDDATSLVNFNRTLPQDFKAVPLFIGTAHTGFHVFPGYNGIVIEGHSVRHITSSTMIETSEFNPLKPGGGPQGLPYRSGLFSVPPGHGY